MEKKQTAVEFFVEQSQILQDKFDVGLISFLELCRQKVILLDQAKQMEKEQMKEAALDNVTTNEKLRKIFEIQFEDFFKETYGGQDE